MQKAITYLYLDADNAGNLKMFQDRTNQIRAFYFTRETYKQVHNHDNSSNYAIYFLFDDSNEESEVYIGQSINGINRIDEHFREKNFWSYGILFVTDNNSFDKLSIDYLEQKFIQKFKKSSYVLKNKDLRSGEPNVSVYDKPNLDTYIEQIEFLLNAEKISLNEAVDNTDEIKCYYPSAKHDACIFVKDGKFILKVGSEIKRPPDSTQEWKNKKHFEKGNIIIDGYLEDGKVIEKDGKLITQVNLAFKAPSPPANLITGLSENGWKFFKGLEELRKGN